MYRQNRKYVEITQPVKRNTTLKIVLYIGAILHLIVLLVRYDYIIHYQSKLPQ